MTAAPPRLLLLALVVLLTGCPAADDDEFADDDTAGDDDTAEVTDLLDVQPAELHFGYVELGTTATGTLALTNVAEDTAYLEDIFVEGDASFVVLDTDIERILVPEAYTDLPVEFTAIATVEKTATLWILGAAGGNIEVTVPMTGTGIVLAR